MRRMNDFKFQIASIVHDNICTFYTNVSKKYANTYSFELMEKNINDTYNSIYQIENGLLRREPTINRWEGKGCMAKTDKWYFLYHIDGDTIYVDDACHSQNMHENIAPVIHKLICEYLQANHMMLLEHSTRTKKIRLKEGQLRDMLGYVVSCILDETYKVVGSPDHFIGTSGKRINDPVLSLEDEFGGKTHVIDDDGCYVAYKNIVGTDKFEEITHLYPELFNAMKRNLPKLPQR